MIRSILMSALCVLGMVPAVPADGGETIQLFNGQNLDGWTFLDGSPVDSGWEAVDGVLHLRSPKGSSQQIVTDREFGDFELRFEWKIAEPGNSGVKYRVADYGRKTLGLEYQLLDEAESKNTTAQNGTASIYDLFSPAVIPVPMNGPGEFNESRIVVRCNRVQHYLNGQAVLDIRIGDPTWLATVANTSSSIESNG